MKVNLGCGTDIRPGYCNIDSVMLPGVDRVFDLDELPWRLEDDSVDEAVLINVLEHLDDTVAVIEEIRRICRKGAVVTIRVPYYNSPDMFADPTHRRFFSERTLDFFDPRRPACQERPYYSSARFHVEVEIVYVKVLGVYLPIRFGLAKRFALWLGRHIAAVVWVLQYRLTAV